MATVVAPAPQVFPKQRVLDALTDELLKVAKSEAGVRGIALPDLRRELVTYAENTGRRPSLEYALIAGVNDTAEELTALIRFARGLLVHVNLIPVNPVRESGFGRATDERVAVFQRELHMSGIQASVRAERGADIDAACGQLRQQSAKS